MAKSKEELQLIIAVLQSVPELHYRSCFEDMAGRPEFNCNCPTKKITDKYIDKLEGE